MPERRSWRQSGAVVIALVTAVWSAVQLWPVLRAPAATIPNDAGDPILNASILYWNATRPPLTPDWWNFPAFAPLEGVTTFTEHLLGLWPIASPVIWITGDPVLAYNAAFYLSFVLNAVAMYALVRHLTGSAAGAAVAALAFTFNPYRGGQFSHIQMLMTWGMPLALYGLHRYLGGGGRAALILFGFGWLATALSNGYFLVFFGVYVACWVLWFCTRRGAWQRLPGIAAAVLVASLPLVPILLTYVSIHARYGLTRPLDEIRSYAADVSGLLFAHPAAVVVTQVVPALHEEGALFSGFTIMALAVAGVVVGMPRAPAVGGRRTIARIAAAALAVFLVATIVAVFTDVRIRGPISVSISSPHKPLTGLLIALGALVLTSGRLPAALAARDQALFYALSALLMWLLSLGPEPRLWGEQVIYQPPYVWLLKLPGFEGLRVPARFWMLALMSLCVLAGFAVAAVRRQRSLIVIVTAAAVLAEGWMRVDAAAVPERFGPRPATRDAVVLELPVGSVLDEIAAQFRAVAGGYRSANGYSGYEAPHVHPLRVGLRLREQAVLNEMRRLVPLHVSVIADDRDRYRSWLVATQPDATPVSEAAGRVLYALPRLPAAPPSRAGSALPIAVSGASCSEETAPLVLDGSLHTRWECGLASPGQQIRLDLGVTARLSDVSLALGPFAMDAPRRLLIEASEDGTVWEPVWSGMGAPPALAAALRDPRRVDIRIPLAPLTARHLRLTQTGDRMEWFWSVAELAVYGQR